MSLQINTNLHTSNVSGKDSNGSHFTTFISPGHFANDVVDREKHEKEHPISTFVESTVCQDCSRTAQLHNMSQESQFIQT